MILQVPMNRKGCPVAGQLAATAFGGRRGDCCCLKADIEYGAEIENTVERIGSNNKN
jgi:hypothetical protein